MSRPADKPREPCAPDPRFLRWTNEVLPPYRYIPGVNRHPVRDPLGHAYGKSAVKLAYIAPEKWRANPDYLRGVDLYNYAYWWEAHEAWENVWHTTDKDSAHGQFLQGLIQIAAAFIKWQSRERLGLVKLFDLGIGRLRFAGKAHPFLMGVELKVHNAKLAAHFAPVLADPDAWPEPTVGYPFLEPR